MKKIALSFLLMLFVTIPGKAYVTNVFYKTINIKLQYIDPHYESYPIHRIPANPVMALQNGHTFTFPDYLAGETIEIMSGDTVVYTSVIDADGTVTAPDNLTGEYILVLHLGDKMYSAEIEL